jgi:ATP-dependent Lon protease
MGVRQLERNLAKICRKMARKNEKLKITAEIVTEILGPIKKPERWKGVGVVNGMAWT